MSKILKLAAGALAALSLQAQAVVIDNFDDPTAFIFTTTVAGTGATTAGGMIGGERDILITSQSGDVITAQVAGSKFVYGQSGQGIGQAVLRWDGSTGDYTTGLNTAGLGSENLAQGAVGFKFNVFTDGGTIDQGGPLGWVKVEIWGNGGTESATTLFPAISFTGDVLLGFSDPDWVFSPGFSFTDVSAIQVTINVDAAGLGTGTAVSLDVTLDIIETVPEPTSIALMGVALLGAGVARRRSKSA